MPYTAITRDSRHPFETYILTACAIGGMFALFGNLWPSAIEAAFPLIFQQLWGIGFAGGALFALIGIEIKDRPRGIFMEQIGLINVAATCFTYAAALLVYSFGRGFVTAVLFALIGAASIAQWRRLEEFVRTSIKVGESERWRRRGRG